MDVHALLVTGFAGLPLRRYLCRNLGESPMLPTFSSMRSSHGAPVLSVSAARTLSYPVSVGQGHTFLVQGKIAASLAALRWRCQYSFCSRDSPRLASLVPTSAEPEQSTCNARAHVCSGTGRRAGPVVDAVMAINCGFASLSEFRLNHISGPCTAVQLSSRGRRQLSSCSRASCDCRLSEFARFCCWRSLQVSLSWGTGNCL